MSKLTVVSYLHTYALSLKFHTNIYYNIISERNWRKDFSKLTVVSYLYTSLILSCTTTLIV